MPNSPLETVRKAFKLGWQYVGTIPWPSPVRQVEPRLSESQFPPSFFVMGAKFPLQSSIPDSLRKVRECLGSHSHPALCSARRFQCATSLSLSGSSMCLLRSFSSENRTATKQCPSNRCARSRPHGPQPCPPSSACLGPCRRSVPDLDEVAPLRLIEPYKKAHFAPDNMTVKFRSKATEQKPDDRQAGSPRKEPVQPCSVAQLLRAAPARNELQDIPGFPC